MSADPSILKAQQMVLGKACDPYRGGVLPKVLAHATGIKESTLASYFRASAPAEMPLGNFRKLFSALTTEELSMLLPPGFAVVPCPEGTDHDGLAARCLDYAAELAGARHPQSEAGTELGKNELARLDRQRMRLAVDGGV